MNRGSTLFFQAISILALFGVLTGCDIRRQWAMEEATEEARRTAEVFSLCLARPDNTRIGFSVKALVVRGEHREEVWLSEVRFDGERFHGSIDSNQPDSGTVDDDVVVSPEELIDWMFIENGELRGGYTIRALRRQQGTRDRADFDRQFGFRITDQELPFSRQP